MLFLFFLYISIEMTGSIVLKDRIRFMNNNKQIDNKIAFIKKNYILHK